MLCKLKNLLPEDTRIVELTSSISVFFSCVAVMLGASPHNFSDSFILFSLGVALVQFLSLVLMENRDSIRVYSSLIMGGLLIYLGTAHFDSSFDYITQFTLGIANLYAFLLNNQRLAWK